MISSDKAGVQFPDSESSFYFCSTVTNHVSFSFGCMVAWRRAGCYLLPRRTSAPTQHQVRRKAYHSQNTKASRNFGSYGSSQRFRNAQLIVIQTTAFSSSSTSSVRTGPGQRWLLASPHGDTTFNSWLRTNGRVFSGPWLANKTEKMARITWQKLELEISDLAMEDWGKAQEPG